MGRNAGVNLQAMGILAGIIEQRMVPLANWLTRSKHVMALRDGFQLALPFIIVGSLLVPLFYPPVLADSTNPFAMALLAFSRTVSPWVFPVYTHTLGLISLIVAFGTSSSLAKAYQMPERLSGIGGCVAFLLLIDFGSLPPGIISGYLSGSGIFMAICVSIYSVEIARLFYTRGWCINMVDEVPLMTRRGFRMITPLLFVMLSLSLIKFFIFQHFGISVPELMSEVFRPLLRCADTLPALLISLLVAHLLWFMGIHGALIVTGIMAPFWMANLAGNQDALASGGALPHIYLQAFWDYYLLIGGIGGTLPLVFMALRSQNQTLKSVGKLGLVPALFNINEPILFGFPIIMNPLFLLPFILVPLVNGTLAWILTDWGVLDRFVALLPWSMPSPLGATWAANGSWHNLLMSLFCIFNSWMIYRPFFLIHEKMQQEQGIR